MTIARCGVCEQLSVLEVMGRLEYSEPGMPDERGRTESAEASLKLCPACARKATKHLKRMFGRRWLSVTKARRGEAVVR